MATAKADKSKHNSPGPILTWSQIRGGAGVVVTSATVMAGWQAHGPCKEVRMITGTARKVVSRPGLVRLAAMADSDTLATLVGG